MHMDTEGRQQRVSHRLVQTDNYLYTGLSGLISWFEQFTSQKFKVGSIEHDSFKGFWYANYGARWRLYHRPEQQVD
jgi:hypothetical protein